MRNPESNINEEEREPSAPPKVDPKFAEERVGGFRSEESPKAEQRADYNEGKKSSKKAERNGENYDYEILGVSKDASREEIDAAYRKLAKETHPDMGGNAEDFKRVNAAYESLVNRQNGGQKKERGAKTESRTGAGAEDMSEREKRMREKARQTEENIRKARQEAEEEMRKAMEEASKKYQEAEERIKKGTAGEKPKEETKKCPNCGAEMPISANFCRACGNKFGAEKTQNKCSNCGTPLREGASFCGACVTKVK